MLPRGLPNVAKRHPAATFDSSQKDLLRGDATDPGWWLWPQKKNGKNMIWPHGEDLSWVWDYFKFSLANSWSGMTQDSPRTKWNTRPNKQSTLGSCYKQWGLSQIFSAKGMDVTTINKIGIWRTCRGWHQLQGGISICNCNSIQADIGIEPSKVTDNVTYVAYPDYLAWSPAVSLNPIKMQASFHGSSTPAATVKRDTAYLSIRNNPSIFVHSRENLQ